MKKPQTFDNFLVSSCNVEAYQACRELVEEPKGRFLVLYGPNASGKTHLLWAISKAFQEKYPHGSVFYGSLNDMLREFLDSMEQGTALEHQQRFRRLELLMVDDMQFLTGRFSTQTLMGECISALLTGGKTVVLAVDRPVQCLQELLEAVGAKAQVLELKEPDEALRKQYLEALLQENRLQVPQAVKNRLLSYPGVSLTLLHGYVLKLLLQRDLKESPLTVEEMLQLLLEDNVGI